MNKKQKIFLTSIALLITVIMGIAIFYNGNINTEKVNIVVTFYPLAYLSQQIGGDLVQVTQLVPDNTEIHSWEPSASSIIAAENADIIIYNGADLDHWIEYDILPVLSSNKLRVIVDSTDNLQLLSATETETAEDHHAHSEYDPHTWVSPYMAKLQAEKIFNALVQVDPEHQNYYTERWEKIKNELTDLDENYQSVLSTAQKTGIFVSHEAFGYLAHRYGFEQYGVIGLSGDEQPSANTIANLINRMMLHETYVVYVDPVHSDQYIQTIKSEVQKQTEQNVTVLELYLMLGPTDNMNLIEQMEMNLNNLRIGLEAT